MTQETEVLYNAQCPVCSFEIDHYADYSKDRELPIAFNDLNTCEMTEWGLSRDQAARRLYVLHEGELTSGVDAFLILWRQMPRYRWLAALVGLPGIRQIASFSYDYIVAPIIYRWHVRRLSRAAETRPSGDVTIDTAQK